MSTEWDDFRPELIGPDDEEAVSTEVEALRRRVAELEPFEPRMKGLEIRPAGWTMTVSEAKNASAGFVAAARGMLDGTGADNYVEQEIFLGGEQYVIIYCRPGGKTPHRLREEAEAEVVRLLAENERMGNELTLLKTPPDFTNAAYNERLQAVWTGILTEMLESGASTEAISRALLQLTKTAIWAVEREMGRIVEQVSGIKAMVGEAIARQED